MERPRVILAHGLRSYREVIAHALRVLRPGVEVIVIEPVGLDSEIEGLNPCVVICSHTTAAIRRIVSTWVELYREHDASVSYMSVDGELSKVEGAMELEDLISIIDRASGCVPTR